MNKRQLTVQKQFVKNEKAVMKEMKHVYSKSLAEIEQKIKVLTADKMTQSKIYQLEYQLALRKQISDILDKLRTNNYDTITKYLDRCYKEGFVGAMYDLQGQGIPLAFPLNQNQVVKAIQLDSRISQGLYERLGFNVEELKKRIADEIARGISNGDSWERISRNLELMTNLDHSKSIRIIRTEGHRIQQASALDALKNAKDCGADVVKQWDSTLDDLTRETHQELDGQIVGIDEDFVIPSTGARASAPSMFGDPAEDCNCRCCVLQRAKWNIDNYDATKMDGLSGLLVEFKEKDYDSFKTAYFKAVTQ